MRWAIVPVRFYVLWSRPAKIYTTCVADLFLHRHPDWVCEAVPMRCYVAHLAQLRLYGQLRFSH